jgi:hypothetical protein
MGAEESSAWDSTATQLDTIFYRTVEQSVHQACFGWMCWSRSRSVSGCSKVVLAVGISSLDVYFSWIVREWKDVKPANVAVDMFINSKD